MGPGWKPSSLASSRRTDSAWRGVTEWAGKPMAVVAEVSGRDFVQGDEGLRYGSVAGHGMALIATDGQEAGLACERFAEHAAGPA